MPIESDSALTALKLTTSSLAPVFCVPGAGANVLCLVPLANAIGKLRSVYGFQSRGLDGEQPPHSSVAAIAADYLRQLRRVQPAGPYHLIGHSFGGWVVFEMALMLRAAGEEVATLALLDSAPPSLRGNNLQEQDPVGVMLEFVMTLEDAQDKALGLSRGMLEALDEGERLLLLKARMVGQKMISPHTPQKLFEGLYRVYCVQIATPYQPNAAYPDHVLLIEAAQRARRAGRFAGWQQYAPRMSGASVAATHMSMLTAPFAVEVASMVFNENVTP